MDVIIPCYRYGHFLRECVESVLTQSGPTVRILIIDDASPDDTAEIAEDLACRDERVRFLKHVSNMGHIATYNEGIAWASADYMVLLSADDYLLPDALRRSAELMDRYPSVGFTFGRAIPLDHGEEIKPSADLGATVGTRIFTGLDFIELSGARNVVLAPSVMVRTALQKKLGGYAPELTHSGDMEMWLRFAAHGCVGFLDTDLAVYRRHATNMSRGYSPEQDLRQRKAAFDHFFSRCSEVLEDAPTLRRSLLLRLACDAVGCASRAFNEDNMDLSRRLSEHAVELDPRVKQSLAWFFLNCKWRLASAYGGF